jgi:hypothetical protein
VRISAQLRPHCTVAGACSAHPGVHMYLEEVVGELARHGLVEAVPRGAVVAEPVAHVAPRPRKRRPRDDERPLLPAKSTAFVRLA